MFVWLREVAAASVFWANGEGGTLRDLSFLRLVASVAEGEFNLRSS